MLPLDRVLPMIRHDDPLVVDLAVQHLKWIRSPEPITGDFVLEAVCAGLNDRAPWLGDFTPSAAVLDFAIDAIENGTVDADASWPARVIDRAPDALFTADVISRLKPLHLREAWSEAALWERLELLDWPTERLRTRFLEACAEANQQRSAMSQQSEIRALADRLVYRGDSVAWMLEHFDRFSGGDDWAEIWLAAMLVRSRQRHVLDVALERYLEIDFDANESLAQEFAAAVGELSEPHDVPRLDALLRGAHEAHRRQLLYAISCLRFPQAETLLLGAADESSDPDDLTYIAMGLCEMLADSDAALARVADVTDREAFDITYCDLEELAIPLGIIVGRPFPQAEQWRRRLGPEGGRSAQREREIRRRYPVLARAAKLIQELEKKQQALRANRQRSTLAEAAGALADEPVEATVMPLARGPRIGRNDPCPCGSGRKYKKCCLNNADLAATKR